MLSLFLTWKKFRSKGLDRVVFCQNPAPPDIVFLTGMLESQFSHIHQYLSRFRGLNSVASLRQKLQLIYDRELNLRHFR